eukprot:3290005-Rhodomonas_salina.1
MLVGRRCWLVSREVGFSASHPRTQRRSSVSALKRRTNMLTSPNAASSFQGESGRSRGCACCRSGPHHLQRHAATLCAETKKQMWETGSKMPVGRAETLCRTRAAFSENAPEAMRSRSCLLYTSPSPRDRG